MQDQVMYLFTTLLSCNSLQADLHEFSRQGDGAHMRTIVHPMLICVPMPLLLALLLLLALWLLLARQAALR